MAGSSEPSSPALEPAARPRRYRLPLPVAVARPDRPAGASPRTSLEIDVPRRLYVTRELHNLGVAGYEAETLAVLLGVAETIRPSVVFDIGANVGPHALLLPALLDVPVVAFEPAADVAAVLRHLVALNDLRCTVEEIALGETDGSATLFISPTDTSSSLRAGYRDAQGEVDVPLRRLDTYVADSGLHPTLLKIDTETTEPAVLRGAPELLAGRPWIVCEVLPEWTEIDLEDLLRPHDYALYHIEAALPLARTPRISGHTTRGHLNWLFAPEPPSVALQEAILRWRTAIDATPAPAPD